jgi:hypothetical protein
MLENLVRIVVKMARTINELNTMHGGDYFPVLFVYVRVNDLLNTDSTLHMLLELL